MSERDGPGRPGSEVTFLFTDIEGSTRLSFDLGPRYPALLAKHDQIVREALRARGGVEVSTAGDSFFCVFPSSAAAMACGIDILRGVRAADWDAAVPLGVRIGLHRGAAFRVGDDYIGAAVAEASRIMSAAHGGQVLASDAAVAAVAELPDGVTLTPLGDYTLKDFPAPRALYQVQHPDLPSVFPPLRTAPVGATNLAPPTAPTFGRDADVVRVCELFASGARLVTLLGPGGVGKTRLSIAAAATLPSRFPGGVWFVELDGVRQGNEVLDTVAATLGARERPGADVLAAIADRLAGDRALLVLDNLEQIADIAQPVARLLGVGDSVCVLATSRMRIGLDGEAVMPLEPLSIGDDEVSGAAETMFIERARAAGVTIGEVDLPAVRSVCERLDGLPLAIELAAASVPFFGVRGLEGELARHLGSVEGPAERPARQRTLAGAVAWSHELLTPDERAAFRRLAVFSGGASFQAASRVLAAGGIGGSPLALIRSLTDKSLARAEHDGPEPRVRLLEPIRAFASERLAEAEEQDAVADEHLAWACDLAEEASEGSSRGAQAGWAVTLEREAPNLEAAIARAEGSGRGAEAARIASGMHRWWAWAGRWTHGRAVLARAMALPGGRTVQALIADGYLAQLLGSLEEAVALLEEAVDRARTAGAADTAASALVLLAENARSRGDTAKAVEYCDAAEEEWGDPADRLRGLIHLQRGAIALSAGRFERAVEELSAAIPLLEGEGDRWSLAKGLTNMGLAMLEMERTGEARELFERASTEFGGVGDRVGMANALANDGLAVFRLGDVDRARALWESALALYRKVGDGRRTAQMLANIASALLGTSEEARAAGTFREAAAAALFARDPLFAARALFMAGVHGNGSGLDSAFEKAAELYREAADEPSLAATLKRWAERAQDEGRSGVARARYAEAGEVFDRLGLIAERDECLSALAALDPGGSDAQALGVHE